MHEKISKFFLRKKKQKSRVVLRLGVLTTVGFLGSIYLESIVGWESERFGQEAVVDRGE